MWKEHVLKFKKYYIFGIVGLLLSLILGVSGFVFAESLKKIFFGNAQENALSIVRSIKMQDFTKEHCSVILEDTLQNYTAEDGPTRKLLSDARSYCQSRYDISFLEQDLSLCKRVIAGKKQDFEKELLVLDGFETVKESCISKYLTVSFTGGTLFDVKQDFKSEIIVNFGLPFYYDVGDPNSQEFIDHRIEAKKRLISLLEISPKVEFDIDDIVLYSKQARISLDLLPKTKYTVSLKSYDAELAGEQMKATPFTLTTPDFQYFGLQRTDGVTLIPDTFPAQFQLLSYNSDITETQVKICRITNESYAKIEVLESTKGMDETVQKFFLEGIDRLESYDCKTKKLMLTNPESKNPLVKKLSFDFSGEIGNPARSGLYYVTFVKEEDRNRYETIQKAHFFGVIDAHITMKIAKNGKAFFFVNDFSGRPLAGQNIRVYANEFQEKSTQYSYENNETQRQESYFSPLEKNVFTSGALLGKTNEQGILEVDMQGKVKDYFEKTLDSWSYSEDGNWNSFFVTASSDTNLSYVSSKWNGGITPWNFGYTLNSGWWYGEGNDQDALSLDAWGEVKTYMGHSFTERRLYLPGETVHYKAILRHAGSLTLPAGKKFELMVQDSSGKEILKKPVSVSTQGSIIESFDLDANAALGSYSTYLREGEKTIVYGGFSVEIFKNPKFQNEVMLQVSGLDEELVDIKKTQKTVSPWGYEYETYQGNFEIEATIDSKYYSGNPVSKGKLSYKVYKQAYYDASYWQDCFYGCYWEPEKEFYTEGTGSLDASGRTQIRIPVAFESSYDDYRYIVEATVTDIAGDTIAGSNSIIARLPNAYKTWNPQSRIQFSSEKKFYKQGERVKLQGKLSVGKFSEIYENQDVLIIKKKEYYTDYLNDVKGFIRPKTRMQEVLKEIYLVNRENFEIQKDGSLTLKYPLEETGEYVFEYGKLNPGITKMPNGKTPLENAHMIVSKFQEQKTQNIYLPSQTFGVYDDPEITSFLVQSCDNGEASCNYTTIESALLCQKHKNPLISDEVQIANLCENKNGKLQFSQKISLDMLIQGYDRNYFTLVSYGEQSANNPIESDNKITVLSEKTVYKVGETARILVRLPFSGGKILWTEEKNEVMHSEYIDVPGNIFFKEVLVTDAHLPNTYISVVAIPTNFACKENKDKKCIPEYKVGYTEIVGDKSDKKSNINLKTDKSVYKPRDTVTLDVQVAETGQHELAVMVVDDSLIALMGNIDSGVLEKIYEKLPFQLQTSISNIAMLANYYFSRQGIVGGSGNRNLKGGDSAVSSRMIFKNTAYYSGSVLTDQNGKAKVSFTLPDNLTNFRVMALSQSKKNLFGYAETFLEVRKEVLLEPRIPLMLRAGDRVELGANVFNASKESLEFDVSFTSEGLEIQKPVQKIHIPAGKNVFVSWSTQVKEGCDADLLQKNCSKEFTMKAIGKNASYSDVFDGNFTIAQDPIIVQNVVSTAQIDPTQSTDMTLSKTANTNPEKSVYSLTLSNTPLVGIQKTYESLFVYPYGCVEQLLSSTLPNAILKRIVSLKEVVKVDAKDIDTNLKNGYARIMRLQNEDGGFKYWENDFTSDIQITPHVLRHLVELADAGFAVEREKLQAAAEYLMQTARENTPVHTRLEALWAVAKFMPQQEAEVLSGFALRDIASLRPTATSSHELLSYTYALYYLDAKKYASEITKNIETLQKNILPVRNEMYYSSLEDKALLAVLMMDVGMKQHELSGIMLEIYEKDWESYWYSTKEKNAAFLAFVKYMEVYGTNSLSDADIDLGGKKQRVQLDSKLGNYHVESKLSELLSGEKVPLRVTNTKGQASIFAQNDIKIIPLDPLKVAAYQHNMKVQRSIYEVTDETKIADECDWSAPNYGCKPGKGLKLHTGDVFEKGKMYKVILTASFEDEAQRNNLTLEDYIPAGFTVLNSNFLTNAASIRQEGQQNSWQWNQTQNRPEVVMANARYSWGKEAQYEYFVRADFAGEFLYAPLAGYLMYEPTVRANTEFRRIVVK